MIVALVIRAAQRVVDQLWAQRFDSNDPSSDERYHSHRSSVQLLTCLAQVQILIESRPVSLTPPYVALC